MVSFHKSEAGDSRLLAAKGPLSGAVTLATIPGDKSISHRAVILGSLLDRAVSLENFLCSEDCLNTVQIMQALGVDIVREGTRVDVKGVGMQGLLAADGLLDVGNSGTAIRLLTGLLAGQRFPSELSGDQSIQGRPMGRVLNPLKEMGARVSGRSEGDKVFPPLRIEASEAGLTGIEYEMPMASAQVRSALLLAGLYASGDTVVHSPGQCRDHSERLLRYLGAELAIDGNTVRLKQGARLRLPDDVERIVIPSDISSALFYIVLALLSPGLELRLETIGLNPSRTAVLPLLQAMGARIRLEDLDESGVEPVGTIIVEGSELQNLSVDRAVVGNVIDEFPILAVAGMFSEGDFLVRGAAELRVKESDRISAIVRLLHCFSAEIEEYEDGFLIRGGGQALRDALKGQRLRFDSGGDHRLAMSAAIAARVSGVELDLLGVGCVATSFPGFFEILEALG